MIRDFFAALLKELLDLPSVLLSIAKEGRGVLRAVWRLLMRKSYEKLTGTVPEDTPTLFEIFATLKVVISGLPPKQRWVAYTGCVAVVAAVCLLVGTAVVPNGEDSGGGGGSIKIGSHTYYQPEFSKLDCLTCDGDGDCNTCHGYGEVDRYAGAGDTVRSKCSSCYGSGNCRTCGGSGKR